MVLRDFLTNKMLIFVKYLENQKRLFYFVLELETNARVKNSSVQCGDVFLSAYNNSINLLNQSESRCRTLLTLAKKWFSRFFCFYKFLIFRQMQGSKIEKVENVNNSNVSAVYESSNNTPYTGKAFQKSKTQVLSEVMSDAWRFFKMTGASFSECLQRAWRNYNLVKRMVGNIVHFYYQKVDGSVREAYGTLLSNRIPESGDGRKKNPFVQVYFDTEKNEWRSFKRFNLVSIA